MYNNTGKDPRMYCRWAYVSLGEFKYHYLKDAVAYCILALRFWLPKLLIYTVPNLYDAYFMRKFGLVKPNSYVLLLIYVLNFWFILTPVLLNLFNYLAAIPRIFTNQ